MRLICKTHVAFVSLAATLSFFSPVLADDEKPAPAAPSAEAAEKKTTAEEIAEKYRVLDGGVKELLAFVKHLVDIRAATPSDEYEANAFGPMKAAVEKIMKSATDEDRNREGFRDAEAISLYFRVSDGGDNPRLKAQPLSEEERKKLLNDLTAHLAAVQEPSQYALTAANLLPKYHEMAGRLDAAKLSAHEIGPLLLKSKNSTAILIGKSLVNSLHRLDLPGKPINITGELINGAKFDWSKYRGKVVLVDFWATSCGACVAETPNLKAAYKKYHDRGFDIVGISLDEERESLAKYLVEKEIPWVNLYDGRGDTSPIVEYYGISGIPVMILVGKDGNVITTEARGEELTTLLEKLFPAE